MSGAAHRSTGQSAHASADEGVIVTPHPMATEAGLDVLRRGGNAAEAVIAAGAVLTVVCPHFCGLGGDGIWMLADDEGRRVCIPGLGQAAENVRSSDPISVRGAGSALTSAGLVAGWEAMLSWSSKAWGGNADADDLLHRAEEIAAHGHPISKQQIFWTAFRKDEFRHWPELARVFLDNGNVPAEGTPQRQAELAATFKELRREGLRSFYSGALGQRIAQGLETAGSPLRLSDLEKTRCVPVAPVSLKIGNATLFAPPRPTQGETTLTIMGVLSRIPDLATRPAHERLHFQVEAVKQAFLRRAGIADPSFTDEVSTIASETDFADMTAAIDADRALPWGDRFQSADTVYLAASDRAGRHASCLQSTYYDWGSAIMAGDTGIVWNNRGAAFSSDGTSPNAIAPGKRPFHTLNPGIAVTDDGRTLLYGTQGADGQPQTLAVLLTEVLLRNKSPLEALAAPRFLLGRTFSGSNVSLKIERAVGDVVLRELEARGHEVAEIPELSPLSGQAGVVLVNADRTKIGAHDPRGDGTASAA